MNTRRKTTMQSSRPSSRRGSSSSDESIAMANFRATMAATSPTTSAQPTSPEVEQTVKLDDSTIEVGGDTNRNGRYSENFKVEQKNGNFQENVSGARRLVRRLSEVQKTSVEPPTNRRFSLLRRHSTVNHRQSDEFCAAWLRTSNFNLSREPRILEEAPSVVDVQAVVPMGRPEKDELSNSTVTFQLDDSIERPNELPRSSSQLSLDDENDDESSRSGSGGVDAPPTRPLPRSAEDIWIHSKTAKTSMLTACTAFYALFLTIFALVLELSHLLNDDNERKTSLKDMIFGVYMYGGSLLFFSYMYIVLLLNPRWYSTMEYMGKAFSKIRCSTKKAEAMSESSSDSLSSAAATVRKVTHSGHSAGSLFLRLGCIVFGVIGVVYYAFLVFLCTSDKDCSKLATSLDICGIFFTFVQMHFIFCNWKLSITGAHLVARIGTMHLVAANLWTWIRYVLMEEGFMEKELREVFKNGSRNFLLTSDESSADSAEVAELIKLEQGCQAAECILGSLSEVMFTAIVEYSLIAAAVMYIVWRNIGREDLGSTYVKRKHQIRVDCSKTTTGLFLGLAFLATTFTSMVVYYGYTILKKSQHAAWVYAFTDIFQYVFSTIGCVIAIYQIRALKYFNKRSRHTRNDQELLDQILLSIGLVGELIYSVAGLVGLTGETTWTGLVFVLLFVHIFRLIQVGTQTFLLYVAKSVRIGSEDREAQPGKQAITFLLTANLAIFFMNLFESEKAGVSEIIINYYGKRSWVFLVRSFSPLTIFYRFHSSVCFAEIWKNVYASKSINGHVHTTMPTIESA